MPVDWDKLEKDVDSIIEAGAQRADERLAVRMSSVTRMTDEEVNELFPEPGDAKKLVALMKVVRAAEARNTKINNIVTNVEQFAGVILVLLEKFA